MNSTTHSDWTQDKKAIILCNQFSCHLKHREHTAKPTIDDLQLSRKIINNFKI